MEVDQAHVSAGQTVNMLSFAYMPIFSSEHSAREKGELYLD
jgi:hypothetical protein